MWVSVMMYNRLGANWFLVSKGTHAAQFSERFPTSRSVEAAWIQCYFCCWDMMWPTSSAGSLEWPPSRAGRGQRQFQLMGSWQHCACPSLAAIRLGVSCEPCEPPCSIGSRGTERGRPSQGAASVPRPFSRILLEPANRLCTCVFLLSHFWKHSLTQCVIALPPSVRPVNRGPGCVLARGEPAVSGHWAPDRGDRGLYLLLTCCVHEADSFIYNLLLL